LPGTQSKLVVVASVPSIRAVVAISILESCVALEAIARKVRLLSLRLQEQNQRSSWPGLLGAAKES
jgi:hypothetical protein